MKKKRYQPNEERTVLTGMIVSDQVLDTIARHLKGSPEPFRSRWSNLIARWCFHHYEKYKQAPKKYIQGYFSRFAGKTKDEDTVELVETFLRGLSEDYAALAEEINVQFVVDTASRYFNEIRLERLSKTIESSLQSRDIDAANKAYHEHEPVEFVTGREPDLFDPDQQKEWLTHQDTETLVQFSNDLGEFIGSAFERDSFIAFAGPEKRGKSYWLAEVVWRALRQRRRVLYYVVGDMSERQAMVRLLCRASRFPIRPGTIRIPVKMTKKKGDVTVEFTKKKCERITPAIARDATLQLLKVTAAKKPRLKSRVYESSTISAADVESEIVELSKEDWVPDVVVIDYADILTAEPHARQMEYRHQINETWKTLRRISQRFHLCLVTATQTAATSYESRVIKKTDFSEDKRKAGHVTGMLGINQTAEEKVQGIYRLNWVFLRDGVWADHQVVYAAGNLAVSCPCIISSLF